MCVCVCVCVFVHFSFSYSVSRAAGISQSVYRLPTGWTVRGSNPGGGEIFRTFQAVTEDRLVSCTVGTGSLPQGWGHGVIHSPPSSAEVKERIELYLYSPSRLSWPVIGRVFTFVVFTCLCIGLNTCWSVRFRTKYVKGTISLEVNYQLQQFKGFDLRVPKTQKQNVKIIHGYKRVCSCWCAFRFGVITSCAGNLSEIPAVSIFKVKWLYFPPLINKVGMHVGSMVGIFSNACLLLPRHPVGITSLALRFLIRQGNMLTIFFVL